MLTHSCALEYMSFASRHLLHICRHVLTSVVYVQCLLNVDTCYCILMYTRPNYVHTHTYAHMHHYNMNMYMHTNITHTFKHKCAHTQTHMCTNAHTHTCTHTHIHIHRAILHWIFPLGSLARRRGVQESFCSMSSVMMWTSSSGMMPPSFM